MGGRVVLLRPPTAALHHAKSCCKQPADDGRRTCPANDSDHCPIVQLREQSVAPTIPAAVGVVAFAVPLPTWLSTTVPMPVPAAASTNNVIQPATGPPTLLRLHTSLVT